MMTHYTKSFIAMHWVHAVLLTFILLGASLVMPDLPEQGGDLAPFKMHIILGILATALTLVRLLMLRFQPEMEPLKVNSLRQKAITWNHRLLYLFILIAGISGFATANSANVGEVAVWGKDPALYTGAEGVTELLADIHGASTTILMLLIAMHIAGVLSYRIKTGECILKRMWF